MFGHIEESLPRVLYKEMKMLQREYWQTMNTKRHDSSNTQSKVDPINDNA